jgi:hypothetical protein
VDAVALALDPVLAPDIGISLGLCGIRREANTSAESK